jgi:hypothetical protein
MLARMTKSSRWLPLALCAFAVVSSRAAVRAEPPDAVAIVVESGGGLPSADQLRAQLVKQFGSRVVSLGAAATRFDPPGALLTIAVDGSRIVNALYWDRTGNADILSVPMPASGGNLEVIASTLASALLTRCLPALDAAPRVSRFDFERQVWQRAMSNPPSAWRAIYAAAGRMGLVTPRGTTLSIEDF